MKTRLLISYNKKPCFHILLRSFSIQREPKAQYNLSTLYKPFSLPDPVYLYPRNGALGVRALSLIVTLLFRECGLISLSA